MNIVLKSLGLTEGDFIEFFKQISINLKPIILFFSHNSITLIHVITLKIGDQILYSNHTFSSVHCTVVSNSETRGAKSVQLQIPLCIESEEEIVELYTNAVSNNAAIRVEKLM